VSFVTVDVTLRSADGAGTASPSSIAKAARVLRALALSGLGGAGVTRLAALACLPKSTAHRVLSELVCEGLVSHTDQQRYRLGQGWFELQSALSTSEWVRLVEQAKSPLAALFEATGATVHFGVLDGDMVLYLEKLTARGGTAVPTRVGARFPLTCTALGKALLAHADDVTVRSILVNRLPVMSSRSITQPNLLLRQLAGIRDEGVAYDREESQAGVFCAAAPVFRSGQVVAAVSVTRTGGRGLVPADLAEVQRAAKRIAEWLVTIR
jgi:DNA-binding IclR family transcriptional regulator